MKVRTIVAALLTAGAVVAFTTASVRAQKAGKTIVVKMIDKSATEYSFEPANVVATTGDIVRFEQTATMPHNIEFRATPAGVDLGAAKASPMMMTPGQTHDVSVDKRFAKGTYQYVCVPHEAMGMKGSITVK